MVLIVTNKEDLASDLVVLELAALEHPVFRLNSEDGPQIRFAFNASDGSWTIENSQRLVSSSEVSGVWYRRPGWVVPDAVPGTSGEYINDQWTTLVRGLASALGPRWINDPFAAARAENKILQLRAATRAGLSVPRTLITNSARDIQAFQKCVGKVVLKALSAPLIVETGEFVFTTCADPEALPDEASASAAPMIVQEAIFPKTDIRATVIGDSVFAAKASSDLIDWRLDESPNLWEATKLPTEIERGVVEACRNLGLVFGAVDLAVNENGFWFLEVNPSGEWAWIESATGLPLARALADCLAEYTCG